MSAPINIIPYTGDSYNGPPAPLTITPYATLGIGGQSPLPTYLMQSTLAMSCQPLFDVAAQAPVVELARPAKPAQKTKDDLTPSFSVKQSTNEFCVMRDLLIADSQLSRTIDSQLYNLDNTLLNITLQ